MRGRRRLDHDRAPAREGEAAPDGLVRSLHRLDGRHRSRPEHDRLADAPRRHLARERESPRHVGLERGSERRPGHPPARRQPGPEEPPLVEHLDAHAPRAPHRRAEEPLVRPVRRPREEVPRRRRPAGRPGTGRPSGPGRRAPRGGSPPRRAPPGWAPRRRAGRARRDRHGGRADSGATSANAMTRQPARRASRAMRAGSAPAPPTRPSASAIPLSGAASRGAADPPRSCARSRAPPPASGRRRARRARPLPVRCASRTALRMWRISSLSGFSLWTNRCSTKDSCR